MRVSPDVIGRGWAFPLGVNSRGGIDLAEGDDEIRQAILLIVRTRRGARVMRPEFGCRIWELLFAPNDVGTWTMAGHHVREALGWWEPRIEVDDVRAVPDPDDPGIVQVEVDYTIKATHDARSLVFPFYLIPGEPEAAAISATAPANGAAPVALAPAVAMPAVPTAGVSGNGRRSEEAAR